MFAKWAGWGGVWEIGDSGEGEVTLVVGLGLEHLMPKTTSMNNLANHGAIINFKKS